MPENNQQPQYVYVQSPYSPYNEPDEFEIDLVELFKVLFAGGIALKEVNRILMFCF